MVSWWIAPLLAYGAEEADRWQQTLEQVTDAVVSVRMDRPRAYEGKGRSNSYATGFVIDAEAGLILTNRHVVTPGPTVARAVFVNQEEVSLVPIYRDPVHDFGLFQYDPQDLKFHDAPELALRPDKARVGLSVRVVGNDAGEQVSILDGTLARLDREAPEYGDDFSDFNTFYIQAASSTSGGSSGSPVVDVDGDAVALNAGGKRTAASSFYLPLDRVVRAVELVKRGEPVSRGTLQTRWVYEPYDELRRLGLSQAAESAARQRAPDARGLLVLREVLPLGPAHGKLKVGDVLISVDDAAVHDFSTLEAHLDDHVGQRVRVQVERGGEAVEVEVEVGDLHALVPDRYLELGGGVLHDLSIHQARAMQVPVRGVYVADNGWSWERDGIAPKAILVEADGKPLDGLASLREHLASVPDGAPVTFRWYAQGAPRQLYTTAVRTDRRWFPARVCTRDDATGEWPCEALPEPPSVLAAVQVPEVMFPPVPKRARTVATSLVRVDYDVPYQVGGLPADNFQGGGLVVDAERGWVVVDRDTVPIAMGEASVIVAGAVRVPARVVALHPVHDLAVVAYDPAQVTGLGITAAPLADACPDEGDEGWLVTLDRDATYDVRETKVRGTEPFGIRSEGPPRFRGTNVEVLELDPAPGGNAALVDNKGRVTGFGASFSYTSGRETKATTRVLPVDALHEVIALAQGDASLRSLGWELWTVDLPTALERGLPAAQAEALIAHDPERRSVLQVLRVVRGSGLDGVVQSGDLVLGLDGAPVTRFRDLERAVRGRDAVEVTVFRNGEVLTLAGRTDPMEPVDIDRVVLWSGVRVHAPHREALLFGVDPARPYIAWWDGGSPAGRSRVQPRHSILAVNGQDVPDLDAFLAAVRAVAPGAAVRLDVESMDGERRVLTVEPDERFWPTEELVFTDGGWIRR